jgi:hypothetical protein
MNQEICLECAKAVQEVTTSWDHHLDLVTDTTSLDNTTAATTDVSTNAVLKNNPLQCIRDISKAIFIYFGGILSLFGIYIFIPFLWMGIFLRAWR